MYEIRQDLRPFVRTGGSLPRHEFGSPGHSGFPSGIRRNRPACISVFTGTPGLAQESGISLRGIPARAGIRWRLFASNMHGDRATEVRKRKPSHLCRPSCGRSRGPAPGLGSPWLRICRRGVAKMSRWRVRTFPFTSRLNRRIPERTARPTAEKCWTLRTPGLTRV